MRTCLAAAGIEAHDNDIIEAWSDYSESEFAGWLTLPTSDDELRAVLQYLQQRRRWTVTMRDAGDGSGDYILPLPDDLVAEMGNPHAGLDEQVVETG